MLIAKNLSKTFNIKKSKKLFFSKDVESVTAVKDVSLKIEEGKIIGLLGLNGAGKTTTIKMLCGIIEPTNGTIFMNNIDVIKNHMDVKKNINLISGGERNIYWRLTARENLEYFGALYNISKDKLNHKIEYLLNMVGLKDFKDIPVERYSKGMKQRLQIARGLINDPMYIFLDEPTLGLDILMAKELREYIKKISKTQNTGVLLTTHYILEAEELCDYIYIIDKGKIILEGIPKEIKRDLIIENETLITIDIINNTVRNALYEFGEKNNLNIEIYHDTENIIKFKSQKNFSRDVLKILENNNVNILNMRLNDPTLEDVLLASMLGGGKDEKFCNNNIC